MSAGTNLTKRGNHNWELREKVYRRNSLSFLAIALLSLRAVDCLKMQFSWMLQLE